MSGSTSTSTLPGGGGTLVSPGVSVSIINESMYVSSGPGTVPLIVIATQTNKASPTAGGGIAPMTVPAQAGQLFLATSQRDLIQNYGNPFFYNVQGTPVPDYELNEFGLWAAYSYLGIQNRAYILRGNIDTSQLLPSVSAPTGPPVSGTYWFDLTDTLWGVFRANGSTTPGSAWVPVTVLVAGASDVDMSNVPLTSFGSSGNVCVVPLTLNNYLYENISGTWYQIGTAAWEAVHPTIIQGTATSATLTLNNTVIINGVTVTVTTSPYHIANFVTDINTAAVPNITASVATNGALVLTNTAGTSITLANGVGTPLTTLGFTAGTTNGVYVMRTNGPSYPAGNVSGSFWVKGNTPNNGASWVVKYYNGTLAQWTIITAPFYVMDNNLADGNTDKDAVAIASIISPSVGALYIGYNPGVVTGTVASATLTNGNSLSINGQTVAVATSPYHIANFVTDINTAAVPNITASQAPSGALILTNTLGLPIILANVSGTPLATLGLTAGTYVGGAQQIRRWSGTAWAPLVYEADLTAPTTTPAAGTYWYNTNFFVDIMYGTGEHWKGYAHEFPETDPNGPQIDGSAPTTQSDGSTPLADGDLWVDSSDLENYPLIYRWNYTDQQWILIDNTDHTSPFGIVFADARSNSGTTFTGILNPGAYPYNSVLPSAMALSDFVEPDAPDPRTYPQGMLLFNTRYSTYNVKQYLPTWFLPGGFDPNTNFTTTSYTNGETTDFTFPPLSTAAEWVTASGNQVNGEPYMGRKAQRIMIVTALAAVVTANQDIRSEINFFNLMCAPGYTELIPDFVTLNTDIKEIAFCIADVPSRIAPNGSAIQNWATNSADVPADGEDGLVTANPYVGIYYPWGLGTNTDGTLNMIPPSAIALTTIAYNDQVAYPWYAPAGFNRGLVTNASSVGYLLNGEYTPTILNQGQRDVLYTNNINPIAYIPRRGLVVYGQKTLSPIASALDRINVARLVNYIAYNLNNILLPFLFEPNVAITRSTAQSVAERFFNQLVGLNGIYDYAVVCDTSNNTPTRIDANELWVDCAIQPVRAVEFIYVPVRILTTQAPTG